MRDFDTEWQQLETAVRATDLPEPAALFKNLKAWKAEIRTVCLTRVTNARTEDVSLRGVRGQVANSDGDLRRHHALQTFSKSALSASLVHMSPGPSFSATSGSFSFSSLSPIRGRSWIWGKMMTLPE